jgi:hypothetical protein
MCQFPELINLNLYVKFKHFFIFPCILFILHHFIMKRYLYIQSDHDVNQNKITDIRAEDRIDYLLH